jgi:hypothetical protein
MPASAPSGTTRFIEAKRLNEMNRLGDLGRFPLPVLAGAAFNVLLTIGVVWHYEPITQPYFLAMEKWIAGVLALNLVPVLLLRLFTLNDKTEYPIIERMNFFRDQHKFSNWVYLAASANMALWVNVVWNTSWTWHTHTNIATVMFAALVTTTAPAWLRIFHR